MEENVVVSPAVVAQAPAQVGVEVAPKFLTQVMRFLKDGNKVFLDLDGIQCFVPEPMRDEIQEDDFCVVVPKQYNSQSIDAATGEPIPDKYDGAPFVRNDVLVFGDYDTVTDKFYRKDALQLMAKERTAEVAQGMRAARKERKVVKVVANAEPVVGV